MDWATSFSKVVLPALEAGKIVLCDRFIDSSLVYQGHARGIGEAKVMSINRFAIGDNMPDLTVYFDVDPEIGLSRAADRGELNRLDKESLNFHKSVRKAYQKLARKYSQRISTVDANQPLKEVESAVYDLVIKKIKEHE